MEIVKTILDFIKNHWVEIVAIWMSLKGVGDGIVKLTETPKDDAIWRKIKNFVAGFLSIKKKLS